MTKDEAIREIEEHLQDADKVISEDEEYIRGWKSALLVALEITSKIEKCVPIELFLEVLEKYKDSDSGLIWECSTQISEDLKKLDEEISRYKELAGAQ